MTNENNQMSTASGTAEKRFQDLSDVSAQQLKELKKQSFFSLFTMICAIVCAVSLAVAAMQLVNINGHVQAAVTQLQSTAAQLESSLNELTPQARELMEQLGSTSGSLKEAADEMTKISSAVDPEEVEKLVESFGRFSEVNIDGLNSSIKALSDIITPLAGLFSR